MRVFTLLLCLALPVAAQEKAYDLSLNAPLKAGTKSRVREVSHMKMSMRANGQVANTSEQKKVLEATEVVVKADGKGNGELRRTFHTAQRLVDGGMLAYGFEGRTVAVKLVKGQPDAYSYPNGAALSEEDLEGLKGSFSGDSDSDDDNPLEPKKPIRVGDSWKPDLRAVAEMFDAEMAKSADLSKSKASFTLRSVETRDGVEFGRIDGGVELALGAIGPMTLAKTIPMTMHVDIDACIDNSSRDGVMKMGMTMKGATDASMGEHQLKLDIDMEAENELSRTTIK